MGLGQSHACVGLAFLVAALSFTACGSTDTPVAGPVSPATTTTTPITTDGAESLVVDATDEQDWRMEYAVDASSPAVTQTSEPSNLVKLCTAVQSWGLTVTVLSIRPVDDIISDIWGGSEEVTVEDINEQMAERLENSAVMVEIAPDAYMTILIEILSILAEVLDGSLPDELHEFAEAYSEFIGERVRTFDFDNPTVNFSSLSIEDLPNIDVAFKECGFPLSVSDSG